MPKVWLRIMLLIISDLCVCQEKYIVEFFHTLGGMATDLSYMFFYEGKNTAMVNVRPANASSTEEESEAFRVYRVYRSFVRTNIWGKNHPQPLLEDKEGN
ncbi:hypothetical protein [Pedobacter paludis]|uniref:Uncharacterized protein n=1 Tax=Pedobacter paludis TaxID=2203212 RepID=A0A317EYT0_9SPHI|nr:hypothetical protein [Pedobacter paludis]PWS31123.1 hypothetical protein DF947_16170 [Pedobacter paludis]